MLDRLNCDDHQQGRARKEDPSQRQRTRVPLGEHTPHDQLEGRQRHQNRNNVSGGPLSGHKYRSFRKILTTFNSRTALLHVYGHSVDGNVEASQMGRTTSA